jgi:hypothetical protein
MRVYADAERGFWVEGVLRVPIKSEPPGAGGSERFGCGVAGGAHRPSQTRVRRAAGGLTDALVAEKIDLPRG